jgi:hypothetical protein
MIKGRRRLIEFDRVEAVDGQIASATKNGFKARIIS